MGIANSLDLTERLLPGLEARGCKPRLVAFPTYTRNQISTVLQERLQALPGPVFAAKALEFCARKVGLHLGFMWGLGLHWGTRAVLEHLGCIRAFGWYWVVEGIQGHLGCIELWAFGLCWVVDCMSAFGLQ